MSSKRSSQVTTNNFAKSSLAADHKATRCRCVQSGWVVVAPVALWLRWRERVMTLTRCRCGWGLRTVADSPLSLFVLARETGIYCFNYTTMFWFVQARN
ncbi:hypothetical protein Q3G72_021968 [Acer saccharum]|nr:hypothetical protein Q3G72_021968 [Acer saccharum]